MRQVLALLMVGVLGGGVAVAQDAEDEAESSTAAPPTDKREEAHQDDSSGPPAHKEGDYGGVVPERAGTSAAPSDAKSTRAGKRKKPRRASKTPLVTWVGFQKREAGARVFVQLSADAAYEQNVVGDTLVVFLASARLGTRNHGRFIDTTFFDTRVARIEAKNVRARRGQKSGVQLTVHFKKGSAAQAQASQELGQDGHRYLFLDFAG